MKKAKEMVVNLLKNGRAVFYFVGKFKNYFESTKDVKHNVPNDGGVIRVKYIFLDI